MNASNHPPTSLARVLIALLLLSPLATLALPTNQNPNQVQIQYPPEDPADPPDALEKRQFTFPPQLQSLIPSDFLSVIPTSLPFSIDIPALSSIRDEIPTDFLDFESSASSTGSRTSVRTLTRPTATLTRPTATLTRPSVTLSRPSATDEEDASPSESVFPSDRFDQDVDEDDLLENFDQGQDDERPSGGPPTGPPTGPSMFSSFGQVWNRIWNVGSSSRGHFTDDDDDEDGADEYVDDDYQGYEVHDTYKQNEYKSPVYEPEPSQSDVYTTPTPTYVSSAAPLQKGVSEFKALEHEAEAVPVAGLAASGADASTDAVSTEASQTIAGLAPPVFYTVIAVTVGVAALAIAGSMYFLVSRRQKRAQSKKEHLKNTIMSARGVAGSTRPSESNPRPSLNGAPTDRLIEHGNPSLDEPRASTASAPRSSTASAPDDGLLSHGRGNKSVIVLD